MTEHGIHAGHAFEEAVGVELDWFLFTASSGATAAEGTLQNVTLALSFTAITTAAISDATASPSLPLSAPSASSWRMAAVQYTPYSPRREEFDECLLHSRPKNGVWRSGPLLYLDIQRHRGFVDCR